MSDLARGWVGPTAVGSGLIGGNVFRACHAFASARLIAGDLARSTDLITGHTIAMTGGSHSHLGRCCGLGGLLTEGLEDLSAQVLSACDGATGAGLITGGLHRAVGLGPGHGLSGWRRAFSHFPVSISGGSLLGTVAIGSGGTGNASVLLADCTGFGPQLAHLLSDLPAGEIRIGLTGHSGCAGGLLTSGFAMF